MAKSRDKDLACRLIMERKRDPTLTFAAISERCGYSVTHLRRMSKAIRRSDEEDLRRAEGSDSVGDAIAARDWTKARFAMARKLGYAFDDTKSARDQKSISLTLAPLMDRCEEDDARERDQADTPHADIMREAREALDG